MELRDYIEMGIQRAGSVTALAEHLGLERANVSNAKGGKRGLPLVACYHLADLVGVPHSAVAAASAMVTEKDAKVLEYLRPFAQNLSKAAGIIMTLSGLVMFSTASDEANAAPLLDNVTLKVTQIDGNTPIPAVSPGNDLYYVNS